MVNDGAVKCLFDAVLSRVALSDGDSKENKEKKKKQKIIG